jgi:hypothetical protein
MTRLYAIQNPGYVSTLHEEAASRVNIGLSIRSA